MKQKTVYLSLARVVAAFSVIMMHVNADCFYELKFNTCWPIANFIECFFSFAVPVFVMISGATLLDYSKRYSTKEFFKRRVPRLLIPYVFWTLLSIVLDVPTLFIYYFMVYLFGVYLCMPLFTYIKDEYKDKVITYVVVVAFVLNYLVPFLCAVAGIEYYYKIPFDLAGGFLIYALIGYLLHKKDFRLKERIVIYAFSILGFALHIGGTYFATVTAGEMVNTFKEYQNVPCMLSAIGVYVLIKQVGMQLKNEKLIRFIEWLSGYSFAIYLVHQFVIVLFIEKVFEHSHSLIYKITMPFLTMAISIVIIWIVRKIPILRKVLS